MKKYHIADVLTASRVVFAVALIVMALLDVPSEWALLAFALGELCDAFDGICARKWHYPDDGKVRWWRVYAVALDQIADILLGVAGLVYVTLCINQKVGIIFLVFTIVVGSCIQALVYGVLYDINPKIALVIVLARRYVYLAAIATVVIMLIWCATFGMITKIALIFCGVVVGIVLLIKKRDRLVEDKTPLSKYDENGQLPQ